MKNNYIKKTIRNILLNSAFFSILLVVGLICRTANAAVQLLGDMTYEYNISPGQIINGRIYIKNPDVAPASVRLIKQDADYQKKNHHHARSNLRWIGLSQEQLTIAPKSTVAVAYRIQAPHRLVRGTHWSKLLIDPVSQNKPKRSKSRPGTFTVGVTQKVRYAVNIMTNYGQGNAKLAFQQPSIKRHGHSRHFEFNIVNQGKNHAKAEVSMELFTLDGVRVASLKGQQRGLFPRYNKTFNIPLAGVRPGQYRALLMATDKKTGKTFGTDIDLTLTP